ncbi:hypothetical protein [Fusobacterium necrophorum]|uniref:Beta-1,4-N-acetylgalactosaminyltransferase n=1 Tax=Fusobacterium necrophorum subsp. funduliforme TaxID=143387 RepID=A0A162ITD6_9FUSO|nr:hypothetical protein [Fusobacterium necrophorum]KYL04426.1 hypothetical protein A2J07_03690 [Fusobacterium necrophorum subsp. funduliforme]
MYKLFARLRKVKKRIGTLGMLKKIVIILRKKIDTQMQWNYRKLGVKYREEPIEIWAFVRAKNEIKTIESCLNSILPVIQKGVIGYNKLKEEEDDGTEAFILDFCKKNPGFIPFQYEHEVIPANDMRYQDISAIPVENRLDTYYNAVLSKLPKNVWMMKIDCDHVFDTEKLVQLPYLIKEDKDMLSFTRMNLHYENEQLFFINIYTIAAPDDWLLLKNTNLVFKFSSGYKENGSFFAWEYLENETEDLFFQRKIYYTDLISWYFPFMKIGKCLERRYFTPFSDFEISPKLKKKFHISEDMLDETRILEFCKNFKK